MARVDVKEKILVTSFKNQINFKDLEGFISESRSQSKESLPGYLAISMFIPSVDVLAVIEQNPNKDEFEYYWEKPVDDFAMAACGELERITTDGESRFRVSSTKGKELLSRVHHFTTVAHTNAVVHLFGGFSFFDQSSSKTWNAFESASFTLPKWMIIKEGKNCILTFTVKLDQSSDFEELKQNLYQQLDALEYICHAEEYSVSPKPNTSFVVSVPDGESSEHLEWVESINKARKNIIEGNFDKVVLARELSIPLKNKVSDTHILNRLRFQYPDCYSFLIRQEGDSSFIGCTPERLASFNSKFVLTEGLAGSTSRGKTASEDAVLEYELLHSAKDLHEHTIVRDAIEENLSHYSDSVKHPKEPVIKKLSNVQHLYTPITAVIKEGVSRTEVLKTLHPTPAVGGFPRENAVEFIKKTERFDRGWYASPVGWINAHGNGEFIVAIRSGLIKNDEVRFFAGCGIVEDSDPEKEWEETNLKFIPMLSALEYAGT